jgi:hypothetical protein
VAREQTNRHLLQTEGEIERFREVMGEKEALDDIDLRRNPPWILFSAANLVVRPLNYLDWLPIRDAGCVVERHRAQIDFSELQKATVVHLSTASRF